MPSEANLAKYFTSGYFVQLSAESLTDWNEGVLSVTNPEFSCNWENGEVVKEVITFCCQRRADMRRVKPCGQYITGHTFPLEKSEAIVLRSSEPQ
ncbi:hypothetical protein AVEN_22942-1 [Araneus ventricosus]|uniref:Uncharacterized protein n=1 Tax=Araneus ventricosus TaxID=182803 RepID=A0A4Y2KVX7_ARAVE|nr:hypothetical protein AVEN_22942-1 [Araneus ventricosus]